MPSSSKIIVADEHHVKAIAGNMLFVIWRRETQPQAFLQLVDVTEDLARSHSRGVGVLQVVETTAAPPSAATRASFKLVIQKLPSVKHYSVVHDGSGFKAASVRAIMTGAYSVVRPPFEHLVASTVREAARWHVERELALGYRLSEQEIVTTVQELRNGFEHREAV